MVATQTPTAPTPAKRSPFETSPSHMEGLTTPPGVQLEPHLQGLLKAIGELKVNFRGVKVSLSELGDSTDSKVQRYLQFILGEIFKKSSEFILPEAAKVGASLPIVKQTFFKRVEEELTANAKSFLKTEKLAPEVAVEIGEVTASIVDQQLTPAVVEQAINFKISPESLALILALPESEKVISFVKAAANSYSRKENDTAKYDLTFVYNDEAPPAGINPEALAKVIDPERITELAIAAATQPETLTSFHSALNAVTKNEEASQAQTKSPPFQSPLPGLNKILKFLEWVTDKPLTSIWCGTLCATISTLFAPFFVPAFFAIGVASYFLLTKDNKKKSVKA
jgi:hypothetical protein